jgi:hypothetical protein
MRGPRWNISREEIAHILEKHGVTVLAWLTEDDAYFEGAIVDGGRPDALDNFIPEA